MMQPIITSRSQLFSLLTEACELEHGLACSYLYAAFTLKQDISEEGITWQQLQKIRLWAAQLYFIAAQEMFHLAQAWNLLSAIGGTPYYLRPNFPQSSKYFPLNLPFETERFGITSLDRFIEFERPDQRHMKPRNLSNDGGDFLFSSVGELYRLIASGFENIPEDKLFIGFPERQVGSDLIDFPNIVKVVDRASAIEAIRRITEQGEGTLIDRDDCHYGIFRSIRRSYLEELYQAERAGIAFQPVRPSISNPVTRSSLISMTPSANLITDSHTLLVAETFDSTYGLMLRMLQYVFDNATNDIPLLKLFSQLSLQTMTTVIKPLAESLTMLSAGSDYETATAGPPFTLSRHVSLPIEPSAAYAVVQEKCKELTQQLQEFSSMPKAPAQMKNASHNLTVIMKCLKSFPKD